jgi:hypothetical protein
MTSSHLTAVQKGAMIYGEERYMEETKLTVRVRRDWIEGAKQYARQNNTTLTRLVSEYLKKLSSQGEEPLQDAPIVKRLAGTLSQKVSEKDYYDYLDEKYGGKS